MTENAPRAVPVSAEPRRDTRRRQTPRLATTSGVLTYVFIALAVLLPVPYMLQLPGPVFNTLGDYQGDSMISVSGAKTYPTDGRIDMLTVAVSGGPGRDVYASQALGAVLNGKETVVPTEAYYPLDTTREDVTASNAVEMSSSQDVAVAAAMGQLDKPYSVHLLVDEIVAKSPSEGKLRKGDRLTSVNGKKLDSDPDAAQTMSETVQSTNEVDLVVDRDGKSEDITLTPADIDGRKAIGITMKQDFEFPVDVKFNVDGVGGPSAGTMFALAIVDELTPGAMTGGKHVAGTGEITPSGTVRPIGGARQKVAAATENGATLFLSPADNCAEVLTAADQSKITVARIDTLDDARTAVEQYAAGNTSDLPKCSADGADNNEKGQ
ncbi:MULTISPECIES: YlbL family protein [unclassified Brevibacterium]|jgi:PDZ domain-containing protein|uniref:YlbL family protein n=1 Tax=unclassified Brevibacterium TaxID=2614124 RepID=UPI00108024E2|nr:S16 family serine protease [Brevibacterium sp. S111]TGD12112.1 PDZ domain-containing protein [Brevibacterium sp. S111]